MSIRRINKKIMNIWGGGGISGISAVTDFYFLNFRFLCPKIFFFLYGTNYDMLMALNFPLM